MRRGVERGHRDHREKGQVVIEVGALGVDRHLVGELRAQVIELITRAQADGRTRVAQMNQAVLSNLTSIITALEHPQAPDES